ncbi:uncharacterized protein TNCT_30461 [Trichonephila clavata]|uniref:Uncharacterized protein n=2 Tax=Trichonephila clavata TaxID=2740835 RepID=A0A8X6KEY0_TRICU|nr:uncharacterized protein TNCT_30461 [Trichonephila clavata]
MFATTRRPWWIAFVCCYINFLHLGTARLCSLLYLAALTRYNVGRSQASFPFILCYTVRNFASPFIGYLGTKFQLHLVLMWGSVLASIGVGGCYFAEDIYTVIVLWGVVFAIGFGMATVLIPEVLSQNFDEYLTNANGLAFSGECIAGFVLPPLLQASLNTYGTSGTFLLLSGMILHGIPAALLLNPKYYRKNIQVSPKSIKPLAERQSSSNEVYNGTIKSDKLSLSLETKIPSKVSMPNKNVIQIAKRGILHINEQSFENTFGIRQNILSDSSIEIKENLVSSSFETEESPISHSYPKANKKKGKHAALVRKETSSTQLLKEQNCSTDYGTLDTEVTREQTPSFNMEEKVLENAASPPSPKLLPPKKVSTFEPFRVFLDPTFLLIQVTQSLILYNCTMFLTIIVDFARDDGLSSRQEIAVLVYLSIADTLGRLGLGWVTDLGFISTASFSAVCCFIMSIAFGGLIFVKEFKMISFLTFVFGLSEGGFLIVCPGVISDHIEEDKKPMALAARFFLYALLSLTQSPLIGYIRGKLGSYDWMLVLLAITCLLSLVTSLLTPVAAKCRDKRKANKDVEERSNLIERAEIEVLDIV